MVYVSEGYVFTSYKTLLVRGWMSALASLGKTLGIGVFLSLLLKNINRKKKILAPDGNLKHSKLEIFLRTVA